MTALETFASPTSTRTKWLTGSTTARRTPRLPWPTLGPIRRWCWTPRATLRSTPTGLFWTRCSHSYRSNLPLYAKQLKVKRDLLLTFIFSEFYSRFYLIVLCHRDWFGPSEDFLVVKFLYHRRTNCIFSKMQFPMNQMDNIFCKYLCRLLYWQPFISHTGNGNCSDHEQWPRTCCWWDLKRTMFSVLKRANIST